MTPQISEKRLKPSSNGVKATSKGKLRNDVAGKTLIRSLRRYYASRFQEMSGFDEL